MKKWLKGLKEVLILVKFSRLTETKLNFYAYSAINMYKQFGYVAYAYQMRIARLISASDKIWGLTFFCP